MQKKDASYHTAAIQYNDELADFAEELAERLEHEVVARWSRAVAKQHRFHSDRHKKALNKLQQREQGAVENTEDGGEAVALDVDSGEQEVHRSAATGQFVTEEEAQNNPDTTVRETVDITIDTPAAPDSSQDASPVHNQGEEV